MTALARSAMADVLIASVLVPQPSKNPEDPLNWSPVSLGSSYTLQALIHQECIIKVWKAAALSASLLVGFTQGMGPLSVSAQIPAYIEQFNSTEEAVLNFSGIALLILGFSNFLWVPLATCWGRRPVALLSCMISLGSCVWRATATSYNSYYGKLYVL